MDKREKIKEVHELMDYFGFIDDSDLIERVLDDFDPDEKAEIMKDYHLITKMDGNRYVAFYTKEKYESVDEFLRTLY